MKVALYSQTYQQDTLDFVVELLDELHKENAEVWIEAEFYAYFANNHPSKTYTTFTDTEGLDDSFDMFVSFGGDGTILRATTFVRNLGIPIVGVNTGRLGFLSTFNKEEVRRVVQEFKNGRYSIIERSLVEVSAASDIPELKGLHFALNEITVSRKDTTSMITVETHLNGEY
uniref:NAD(+)/NADH kinase n=1 Tax=Pricia sp. TaxID=2268138 RepID=UPI0035935222